MLAITLHLVAGKRARDIKIKVSEGRIESCLKLIGKLATHIKQSIKALGTVISTVAIAMVIGRSHEKVIATSGEARGNRTIEVVKATSFHLYTERRGVIAILGNKVHSPTEGSASMFERIGTTIDFHEVAHLGF